MDSARVGAALRAIRIRRGWRQEDVAVAARVSRQLVSEIERGHLDAATLGRSQAIAGALGARLDLFVRWRGGDLDRLLNARQSAMHEQVARQLARLSGWLFVQEVSFSIYGERGVIDILAWHETRRALLVIELKTQLVDVNDLLATMDRRRRLAREIGERPGLRSPRSVSCQPPPVVALGRLRPAVSG